MRAGALAQSSKHTNTHTHTLAHTLPGCFSGAYFPPTRSSEASPCFPSGDLKLEFGLYRRKGRGPKEKRKKADLTDGVGAVNVAGRLGVCLRGAQRCCWTSRERTKSPSHVLVPPPPPHPVPGVPNTAKMILLGTVLALFLSGTCAPLFILGIKERNVFGEALERTPRFVSVLLHSQLGWR